jgi:hypothetical protein
VAVVLIKNQESSRTLQGAPEFGPNGTWPPVETEWLPLQLEVFDREVLPQEKPGLEELVARFIFDHNEMITNSDDKSRFENFCFKPSFPGISIKIEFVDSDVKFSIGHEEGASKYGAWNINLHL